MALARKVCALGQSPDLMPMHGLEAMDNQTRSLARPISQAKVVTQHDEQTPLSQGDREATPMCAFPVHRPDVANKGRFAIPVEIGHD
jgi:hypothetical protein